MNLTRRSFLSGLASAPWWPQLLAHAPRVPGPRRSLILVWLDGGMSHLDTFDGKPEAPTDVRGEIVTRESALPGVFVSEHMPRLSAAMPRCALIRTITSGEGNHDRAAHYVLTGHRPSPLLVYPSLGAVAQDEPGVEEPALPPFVAIPDAHEYARQGFLPTARAPFEPGADAHGQLVVRDLSPHAAASRRAALLDTVDGLDAARSPDERTRDRMLARARRLSLDLQTRAVFDLGQEPAAVQGRFGGHRLGRSCLLARRLVAAGTRTVLVRDIGWDHHVNIRRELTYGFPPRFEALDQALSALIDDLDRSGLCERTVVCVATEFGRTPRLNPAGGRDHWPRTSCALLFGGGIRPGTVVGTTDPRGEEPAERPVSPAELFATLVMAVGLDPATTLRTPDGRPVRVLTEDATPVREILAS